MTHVAYTATGPFANRLFAAGFDTGLGYEIDVTSGAVSTFATGFTNPLGLEFDSSGRLLVSDHADGAIYRIRP